MAMGMYVCIVHRRFFRSALEFGLYSSVGIIMQSTLDAGGLPCLDLNAEHVKTRPCVEKDDGGGSEVPIVECP